MKKRFTRLTALLLALLMLMSMAYAESDASVTKGQYDASLTQMIDDLSLIPTELEKPVVKTIEVDTTTLVPTYTAGEGVVTPADSITVTAKTAPEDVGGYQWMIKVGGVWAKIDGATEQTLNLTYAMAKPAMDATGKVLLRCQLIPAVQTYAEGEAEAVYEDEITYTVNDAVEYVRQDEEEPMKIEVTEYMENETPDENYYKAWDFQNAANTSAVSTFAVTRNAETLTNCNIVINYVFENNEIAADQYTASVAKGSNFSATVSHPTIQGYLPYIGDETETSTEIELNISKIQVDMTYTVTYKPTLVNYTVIHYQQNLDNDKYTEYERETLQGLTGSYVSTTVDGKYSNPEVANTYEGFYALLYEKPEIAADGSTVVEVYYDRNYYLMLFDLDGGYGVEPIYARYGATIGDGEGNIDSVGTAHKEGYTLQGWSLDGGTTIVDLPKTMPAENRTYKAVWNMNETAKVTIVFWGENADDEGYSYIDSQETTAASGSQFIFGGGTLNCTKEVHQHDDSCRVACDKIEHTHSQENNCYTLTCTETSHTHADCTLACTHEHGLECILGCRHSHDDSCYTCGETARVHNHTFPACYTLTCTQEEHDHATDTLVCTKEEHLHDANCFSGRNTSGDLDKDLWTFVRSDVVTVNPNGSTVVNVYYDRTTFTLTFKKSSSTVKTITEKWGADIHSEFPIKNGDYTMWWTVPSGTTSMKPGTEFGSLDTMPAENITFTYDGETSSATLHYYVEALPGADGKTASEIYSGFTNNNYSGIDSTKKFVSYKDINVSTSGWLTYTEEFHNIIGFRQYVSYPKFDKHEQGGTTDDIKKDNYLLYVRNGFDIVYYNPTTLIGTEENVPYQTLLNSPTYNWTPTADQAPAQYEPGSVKFGGWYLNPECSGDPFDFTTATMPAGPNNQDGEVALSLYAKWVPVTHTVSFYLDAEEYNNGSGTSSIVDDYPTLTVPHGSKVADEDLPGTPTHPDGDYTFVGWFYMEDGVEKAFDFKNMQVTKDLKVYGKWSSNVLKEYSVYFKIKTKDANGKEIEIDIADPIIGSTLAGQTKTFDAKGGTDLYTDYQEGYFPLVESHSITLDIEDDSKNTFTFYYVQKDAVPYTVYYVAETLKAGENASKYEYITRDGKTYYIIADTYTNSKNRKAVVTEKFKVVAGYMPDAYQKRLVVNGTDGAVNEIIFYYSVDKDHAYYKITHYTQNTDGKNWTEYATSEAIGDIGTTYTASPMTIDGFTYDSSVEGTVVSGELTANGLELKLYYVRNPYPYKVRYLEQGSGDELADPKTGTGKYGQVISESAIPIENYTPVDPTSQTLTIKIDEIDTETGSPKLNIISFYYKEKKATINYEVVGPTGCGTVNPTNETLDVLSGRANGSTATASSNVYKFVGWYDNAACSGSPISTNAKYVPTKADGTAWVDGTTYYAKFDYNLTELTVEKAAAEGTTIDADAMFIFEVTKGTTLVARFALKNGESVTLGGLTVGDTYTVTEITSWSVRYTPDAATDTQSIKIEAQTDTKKNEVTFKNSRSTNDKWLDSEASAKNQIPKKN